MRKNKNGAWPLRVRGLCTGLILSTFALATQAADDAMDIGPRFAISGFSVKGNSLLPAGELESLLAAFTGPDRQFADVRRAVEALQRAYLQLGYSVVQVQLPEQELSQGVVRIQVIEPRIGRARVVGNQRFSTANIRASLPALREGQIPPVRDLSASLKVANTNPAKQTTLSLESGDRPDLLDAEISVTEGQPWRLALDADNTGSAGIGRTRLGLLFEHANFWDLDHVLTLQHTTSVEKPSRLSVFALGYHVPLYALGDSMDFFASHSSADAGTVTAGVLDLQVSGKGSALGARYNQTLPQWQGWDSRLSYGLDWRSYVDDIGIAEFSGVQLGGKVALRPLSISYSGQLALPSAQLEVNVSGLQNIPGGSNGAQADFSRQRAGASTRYRVLRFGAYYQRQFGGDAQLRLRFNGQATPAALVPGEQFGVGGAGSVRGFAERELAGDKGQFASAEIESGNWCADGAALQCRALVFVDAARLSRNLALAGEIRRSAVASAGLGLRLVLDRRASLKMDYGHVLDGGGPRAAGDGRLHVALSISN